MHNELVQALEQIIADPRYKNNVEYGQPRKGHPEGKVKFHIHELQSNLDELNKTLNLSNDYIVKLEILIHTHDTFKADSEKGASINDPKSHASLARNFAAEFISDVDLLNMIQLHDEGYALYRQLHHKGAFNKDRLDNLINSIQDWNLFLLFQIVDNCTVGKDSSNVGWLIRETRKRKPEIWVDKTHML